MNKSTYDLVSQLAYILKILSEILCQKKENLQNTNSLPANINEIYPFSLDENNLKNFFDYLFFHKKTFKIFIITNEIKALFHFIKKKNPELYNKLTFKIETSLDN